MELLISFGAALVALYAVTIQKKSLKAQQLELQKATEANNESQKALNKQAELQALSSLLNTEIYLHQFNNEQNLSPEKQKKWAAKNFENIQNLKSKIENAVM